MPQKKQASKLPESSLLIQCPRCGHAYQGYKGNFITSKSEMYRGTGYIPVCATCIDELFKFYRKKLGDERMAIKRICSKFDLYWGESVYALTVNAVSGTTTRIRTYISKLNLVKYVGKTFDDTIDEEGGIISVVKEEPVKLELSAAAETGMAGQLDVDADVDEEIVEFWGPDYEPKDYNFLQKRYQFWTADVDVTKLGPSEIAIYQQVCQAELSARKNIINGKSNKDDSKAILDLLGSANLKPVQKQEQEGLDSDLENMPLGVGIQKWETKRPLPETHDNLKDRHHFIKYITVWYFGHLSKMLGLKNSYCKLYSEEIERLKVERPDLSGDDEDLLLYDSVKED